MKRKPSDISIPKEMEGHLVEEWTPMLKNAKLINEQVESNPEKLTMISKIAHIQQQDGPNESALYENSTFDSAGGSSLSAIPGIGNPSTGQGTLGGQSNFVDGTPGSGDKWLSPFKISLQIAAKTIGFDIVSTIPISAPVGMIYYLDYIYSDGRLDGTGNDAPKMFKIAMPSGFTATKGDNFVAVADQTLSSGGDATGNAAKLEYVGKTRISGYAIFKLNGMGTAASNAVTESTTLKIADVFDGNAAVVAAESGTPANANTDATIYNVTSSADYVVGLEDHVYGYAGGEGGQDSVQYEGNFVDGKSLYQGAQRGDAETDDWQDMTVKIENKLIETTDFKVSLSVTQQQLQDMKRMHNWDLIGKSENALVNEASQNINKNILARVFALGWANHIQVNESEGLNLNVALDPSYTSGNTNATYVKNNGSQASLAIPAYQTYATSSASFENQETIQRRIVSKLLAASDMIHKRGRRGPATGLVTNVQLASAIRNIKGYTASAFDNSINSGSLYPMGKVDGMTVYIDPNMKWTDTRICVFRKGEDDDPGLKFLPYLLGESVQTIAHTTMAPKIALISRYALTEYGQHPQLQYLTFHVKVPSGGIV